MGFIEGLSKIIRPIEDDGDNDFFDGSNGSGKTAEADRISDAQAAFEKAFGASSGEAVPQSEEEDEEKSEKSGFSPEGGIFGNLGARRARQAKAPRERVVNFEGKDSQVILFNPKSFDEAGKIVGYLHAHRSVVVTMEGVPLDMARRIVDFLSGVAYALNGRITPVSGKTYFITPENVDVLSAEGAHTETSGEYF